MAVPVVKYSLEITTSAQNELDSIDDPLFALGFAGAPPWGCDCCHRLGLRTATEKHQP
jgi:hypothetical protein